MTSRIPLRARARPNSEFREVDAIRLELPTDHFDERCDDVVDAIEATIDDPDRLVVQVRAETRTVAAFVGLTASLPPNQPPAVPRQIASWAAVRRDLRWVHRRCAASVRGPRLVRGRWPSCHVVSVATRAAHEPAFVADAAAASEVTSLRSIIGDADEPTGLRALEGVDDIDLLAIPDLWTMRAMAAGASIWTRGVTCRAQPSRSPSAQARSRSSTHLPECRLLIAREWRTDDAGHDTPFACLYHPWLTVADPTNGSELDIPPCGHVAGTWARSARERDIW